MGKITFSKPIHDILRNLVVSGNVMENSPSALDMVAFGVAEEFTGTILAKGIISPDFPSEIIPLMEITPG
jgi:hypothetical protein